MAISEGEKGYGFTAPIATMRRIFQLLDLVPPEGMSVEAAVPSKGDSPTLVGYEPPRAALGAPVHTLKLRRVVVAPLKPAGSLLEAPVGG